MSDVPFPDEVLTDLLLRLPVQPLLRFRIVCKPWRSLIDSPFFVKRHLQLSLQKNSHMSIILGGTPTLYSVSLDSLDNAVAFSRHPLIHDKRDPFFRVLGSANGLLCLTNMSTREDISVWNPSTRKSILLPTPPDLPVEFRDGQEFVVDSFGYDETNDDYKVVRIVVARGKDYGLVSVYSMKRNSWARVKDFPNYLNFQLDGAVLASGCLHWAVTQTLEPNAEKVIIAFDLGIEDYRVVQQPAISGESVIFGLAVLGGSLVLCDYRRRRIRIDIWVMREYGVKESWTKLASIGPSKVLDLKSATPLAVSKDGGEVLLEMNKSKLAWYNLKKKSFRTVSTSGLPEFFFAHVCVGSVVQLVVDGGKDKAVERAKNRAKKLDDFLSKGFKLVL